MSNANTDVTTLKLSAGFIGKHDTVRQRANMVQTDCLSNFLKQITGFSVLFYFFGLFLSAKTNAHTCINNEIWRVKRGQTRRIETGWHLISARTHHTCSLQTVTDFSSQVRQIARHPEPLCPLPADWSSVLVWYERTEWDDCEVTLMPGPHSGGCWKPEEPPTARKPDEATKSCSQSLHNLWACEKIDVTTRLKLFVKGETEVRKLHRARGSLCEWEKIWRFITFKSLFMRFEAFWLVTAKNH